MQRDKGPNEERSGGPPPTRKCPLGIFVPPLGTAWSARKCPLGIFVPSLGQFKLLSIIVVAIVVICLPSLTVTSGLFEATCHRRRFEMTNVLCSALQGFWKPVRVSGNPSGFLETRLGFYTAIKGSPLR